MNFEFAGINNVGLRVNIYLYLLSHYMFICCDSLFTLFIYHSTLLSHSLSFTSISMNANRCFVFQWFFKINVYSMFVRVDCEFVNGFHVSAINSDNSNTFYRSIPISTFNLIVARFFCCIYQRLIDLSFRIKLQGDYHECNCFKLISEFLSSGV